MTKETIDSPITLGFSQFVDYAFNLWLDSLRKRTPLRTLCLLGPPGIGKSSTAYAITKKMTDYVRANPDVILQAAAQSYSEVEERALTKSEAVCRLLDFSSMLPEDLNGLPYPQDGYTIYYPQRWAAELCGPLSYGVVVQDDLPAAAPAMHTAGRQMALERRIHDHRFAPGVLVLVTGNRREDKSSAKTLPAHFRNSVCLLNVEPDLDEWKKWYAKQEHLDPIVPAFLTWKPELFSQLPTTGAFATPRQWASLGGQFDAARNASSERSTDVLLAVTAGLVGKGTATSFVGFVETFSKLPDPAKVLEDPKGALPDPQKVLSTPDKQIAMTIALGDMAARQVKKSSPKDQVDITLKLMMAISHTCGSCGEYTATGIQTFLDTGGSLTAIAKIAKEYRKHKDLGPMFDHIKEALFGGA